MDALDGGRTVGVDEAGALLFGRPRVDAVDVRHEDQQVGAHFGRQTRRQTVVVADADHLMSSFGSIQCSSSNWRRMP